MTYEWYKRRVRKWRWCQYCKRTIYKGEYAFSLKGFHAYSICKECHSSHTGGVELREERSPNECKDVLSL